jgi:hypothetical protein
MKEKRKRKGTSVLILGSWLLILKMQQESKSIPYEQKAYE